MKRLQIIFLCFILIIGISACAKQIENTGGNGPVIQSEEAENTLTIDDGKIIIEAIKGTDGLFVEKGDRAEAENISSIVITNNSDEMLEYAVFPFHVNQYERADFIVSALPAGESAVVMESFARPFSKEDEYEIDSKAVLTAYAEEKTESDKVEITTENDMITVKNVSDDTISATVVYKYYQGDMYYGGIAFSGSFEDIKPGESVSKKSDCFGENCKIVNLKVE